MFGQASPRRPASTTLVLMVAFFGIHLTSGLYLPSPVTKMPSDNSSNITDTMSTPPDRFHGNATPSPDDECVFTRHRADLKACIDKAKKEDFANITDEQCSNSFAIGKCVMETLCQFCKGFDFDKYLVEASKFVDDSLNDELCNKWKSKDPKVPTVLYRCEELDQRPESYYNTIIFGTYAALIVVWELAIAFWLANRNR